jgi:hypothetical protein
MVHLMMTTCWSELVVLLIFTFSVMIKAYSVHGSNITGREVMTEELQLLLLVEEGS